MCTTMWILYVYMYFSAIQALKCMFYICTCIYAHVCMYMYVLCVHVVDIFDLPTSAKSLQSTEEKKAKAAPTSVG